MPIYNVFSFYNAFPTKFFFPIIYYYFGFLNDCLDFFSDYTSLTTSLCFPVQFFNIRFSCYFQLSGNQIPHCCTHNRPCSQSVKTRVSRNPCRHNLWVEWITCPWVWRRKKIYEFQNRENVIILIVNHYFQPLSYVICCCGTKSECTFDIFCAYIVTFCDFVDDKGL